MNKIHGVIYLITNLINQKVYIGQTCREKPIKRFYEHIYASNNKKIKYAISRAIKKYGKENFKFEVIDKAFSQEELNFLEEKYINIYKSFNKKYGYNLISYSQGKGKLSEQTVLKMKKIKNTPKHIEASKRNGINSRGKKLNINKSSSYVGVSKYHNKWRSQIMVDNKKIGLGYFTEEIDAAKAYDLAAIKYYGNNCIINFEDLRNDYLNNKIIINKIQKIKKHECSIGISYLSNCNRWRVRFKNKNKHCLTKEIAEKELLILKQKYQDSKDSKSITSSSS